MSSPMSTLRDLAQQDVDDATTALGKSRQAYLHAEQQLSMLPVSYTHLTLPTICSV